MARPKGKKPTVRLSISLDPGDHAELAQLADQYDLTVAWMVRKAVREFIERHRESSQVELPLPRSRQHRQEPPT